MEEPKWTPEGKRQISGLKEAFDLIVGFEKHTSAPFDTLRNDYNLELERKFTDENFHEALTFLGNLKQLKAYTRELWGYEAYGMFCIAVTKRKVKKDE